MHSERVGEADIALVGSLIGDPARARVLLALADGRALPASLLAAEAGVARSTVSHHLAKLVDAGMLSVLERGRYRYFTLAGPDVAELLEALARVAPVQPITSLRQGTRAHAVRYARRCYDHLAGRLGVAVTDALRVQGALTLHGDDGSDRNGAVDVQAFTVSDAGVAILADLGVDVDAGEVVRCCLDWTERRPHIAGRAARALLSRLLDLRWLVADEKTRALRLTDEGRINLSLRLAVRLPETH